MEMLGLATFNLLVGLVDDLRSRKVHNALIVFLLLASLLLSFYFRGLEGSIVGMSAFVAALLLSIPLFMLGILGGGDVKLFAVFAFCLDPASAAWTLFYSVIWGALFGVAQAFTHKQLLNMVKVTYKIGTRQRVEKHQIHKVPYTFALLLGWFTQLTILHAGGFI